MSCTRYSSFSPDLYFLSISPLRNSLLPLSVLHQCETNFFMSYSVECFLGASFFLLAFLFVRFYLSCSFPRRLLLRSLLFLFSLSFFSFSSVDDWVCHVCDDPYSFKALSKCFILCVIAPTGFSYIAR